MSKSVKWAGTCPDGQVITRTTARTYSHAVIGRRVMPGDVSTPWRVVGWCGRLDLAEALAGRQRRGMAEHGEGSPEVVVIPVAPVVRPGSNVDQVTPARVEFVAPADADDILASEVAAMNAALADMARTAVKDLAGGDLAGDLVRSCLDVLAAETPRDMSRAVTGPMEARGDSAALVDLANNVALAARYLSVMAGYLVAGRFPEDVDTIEHFVDVVSTFGLIGSLERLADGAR